MIKIAKALSITAVLSVVCCIFGCAKAPEYTADDIRSVSISCGHMNYSYSYSFYLRKDKDVWLLDAEFAADTESPRIEYEACPVEEKDAEEILNIVCEQQLIKKLRQYKKPKIKLMISDETTYHTSLLFKDGKMLGAATLVSKDLETVFYRLAEKYADTTTETNNTQTNIMSTEQMVLRNHLCETSGFTSKNSIKCCF